MKIILVMIASIVVIVFVGISGMFFSLWPTSFNDMELTVSDSSVENLEALYKKPKFHVNEKLFYFGSPSENIRSEAEAKVNLIIKEVIASIKDTPRKSAVLGAFKRKLPALDNLDSEERDMALNYLDQILSILDISSSNELLNVWRYGLPLGWLLKS